MFERTPVPEDGARLFDRWLRRWKKDLTYISENKASNGWEHYDVEGRVEAINAIPQQIRGYTQWSNPTPVGRGRRKKN
jgi:hypothetical protein